jgi:tripartite-type tricarboxylate transporter receptor subunit TctC
MQLPRRHFLRLAAGAAAFPAMSRDASAQAYPTRPVRIIAGFPPGSAADITARLIGQWLSERLGQQVIVDNRPGASGNVATEAVVRAPADGYTLLLATSANAINAGLYDNLNFNFIRDIAPVASIGRTPYAIVVTPSFPAKTVPELIAYAKANPGKINMASAGSGSAPHIFGALFMFMAGIDMVHVPYRGSYFPDLLGGQVQIVFCPVPSSIGYIQAGKLRALAVTTAARWQGLPDLPSVAEFLPGYDVSLWFGIGAPKDLPPAVIDRLNKEINAGLSDPKLNAQLADLREVLLPMTPAEFGNLIGNETGTWAKVIREANIKPE